MGTDTTGYPRLVTIQIPRDGLENVLRGWSGDGQIFEALAAIRDPSTDIEWSPNDVRRRANRVMLDKMSSTLQEWPLSADQWADILPITTTSERIVGSVIRGSVNWPETVRRFGWPASRFVGRSRSRTADEVALTALAWTSNKLTAALSDIRDMSPSLHAAVVAPIEILRRVVETDLASVAAIRPDRLDLLSLASSGRPWSGVATVAEVLVRAETDLEYLAFELIQPDPDLEWRLFHLAVLGYLILALRGCGGRVRWVAPLTAAQTPGPQFRIEMRDGATWDLWFEGAGASAHYSYPSLYREAVRGVLTANRSIGADIMLIHPGERALLLECKWSAVGTRVGRDGFHQAAGYALEARSGLVEQAWSFVVGPEEIVRDRSASLEALVPMSVIMGSTSVRHLPAIVNAFLIGDPQLLSLRL
jgi:hypothetical protein